MFAPQQTCACHNKTFVLTSFVVTSFVVTSFVVTSFVVTKVIPVAAPTNDPVFSGWALRSTNSKLNTTHSTVYMLIYSTDFVSLNLELFCVSDG